MCKFEMWCGDISDKMYFVFFNHPVVEMKFMILVTGSCKIIYEELVRNWLSE